jgi:hypothetical protein
MYKQIFIPNEQNNNVIIPRKWYGQKMEVEKQLRIINPFL